jgi:hypothetical protein
MDTRSAEPYLVFNERIRQLKSRMSGGASRTKFNRRSLNACGMTTVFERSGRMTRSPEITRANPIGALAPRGQTNFELGSKPELRSACHPEDPERNEGDEGSAVAFQESIRSSAAGNRQFPGRPIRG